MSQGAQLPSELTRWVDLQVSHLQALTQELDMIKNHDQDSPAAWVLSLLEELSNLETVSRRAVHLLTTYALRERLATATVVARRSSVTVTGAQNRAGSKLAQETWNEVWPREDPA